jgi:hypothetical protein
MEGGKAISAGGFGCVFKPALTCSPGNGLNVEGTYDPSKEYITKLMVSSHATSEFNEITKYGSVLRKIPDYQKYFMIDDIAMCDMPINEIPSTDLQSAKSTTCKNVSFLRDVSQSEPLKALQIPYGGLDLTDFFAPTQLAKPGNDIYDVHIYLIFKMEQLLKKGILPMNEKGIYHLDVKAGNILVSDESPPNVRLIDWGLAAYWKPLSYGIRAPETLINRPLMFNLPFNMIFLRNDFEPAYQSFLAKHGKGVKYMAHLNQFVIDYLKQIEEDSGIGHTKYIKSIYELLETHLRDELFKKGKEGGITTLGGINDYLVRSLKLYTHPGLVKMKGEGAGTGASASASEDMTPVFDFDNFTKDFMFNADIFGWVMSFLPSIKALGYKENQQIPHNKKLLVELCALLFDTIYNSAGGRIDVGEIVKFFSAYVIEETA